MAKFLGAPDIDWYKPRLSGVMYVILGAFVILFLRLFYLQVVSGEELNRLSENNSIRLRSLDPPRGLIFDCRGTLLVDNRPAFNLSIIPRDAKPLEATIQELSRYLELPVAQMKAKIVRKKGIASYQPVVLKQDIGRNALAAVEVHRIDLPGVVINVKPQRDYLYQSLAAHLIGYLGEINLRELQKRKDADYRGGDLIGKFGVEKTYEKYLRGIRGGQQVEVNATGQVMRVLSTVSPQQGNSVFLTINRLLQAKAEALLQGKAGAIVALDPRNGKVLALVSSPSFDQNAFVSGMSQTDWTSLISNPLRPMQNKAVQGEYPPASTYKIIVAMAGLEEGIIDTRTRVFCNGTYPFGNRVFLCWKEQGHGHVDIIKAISESCDVFFYQLGQKLGVDRIARYARECGLGKPTGIELDNEASGLVPTADWKKRRFGRVWQKGETLTIAIGQGYNLVTPLQMAVFISAVANGGTLWRPTILERIESTDGTRLYQVKPEEKGRLPAGPQTLELIRRGLKEAVNTVHGTAWRSHLTGIEMCGKTGTAQLFGRKTGEEKSDGDVSSHLIPHAWFVAYAPAENPLIAVAVLVENGESGSHTAAPLAKELIQSYLSPPATEKPQLARMVGGTG